MLKKLIILICVICIVLFSYFIYDRVSDNTYSLDLEEQLVVNGSAYKKVDKFWAIEPDKEKESLGRMQEDITDFFFPTRIYESKNSSGDFICTDNMYKTEAYKKNSLDMPEFVRCNIEYIVLNNERIKNKVLDNKIKIEDSQIIDYLYKVIKNTQNEPFNKSLREVKNESMIELCTIQFKLKGLDSAFAEPSVLVKLTDGDYCIYNKTSEYYNKDTKLYNTYVIDKNIAEKILEM